MKSIKSIRLLELLSGREKILLLSSYIGLVLLIAAPMVYFDVTEAWYQYSRQHEHLQLDELFIITLVALFIFGIYLILITAHIGKRLLLTKSEKQGLERSIDQNRHLVAMGTVLGGVSHSVNNHLLPVIALTEAVIEDLDPNSAMAKDLSVVLNAAIGAAHILRQLKNFSRQEMVVRETCNIGDALWQAIHLCEKIVPSSVRVDKDLAPLSVRVALSEVSVEIVVLNLMLNAVDAIGGATGTIGISLAQSEAPADASDAQMGYAAWVSLRVEDSGEGMSNDQISKIFVPFYTTKPVGMGTGLGLSETFGIIKAGGGCIDVESTPGVSTVFTIHLPVLVNEDRLGGSRFTPL